METDQPLSERQRWRPSIGQLLCIGALLVGVVMVVTAVLQSERPDPMQRLSGEWFGPGNSILELRADGTAIYRTNKSRSPLRWSYADGQITIAWPDGRKAFPSTRASRVENWSFATDSRETYWYVGKQR